MRLFSGEFRNGAVLFVHDQESTTVANWKKAAQLEALDLQSTLTTKSLQDIGDHQSVFDECIFCSSLSLDRDFLIALFRALRQNGVLTVLCIDVNPTVVVKELKYTGFSDIEQVKSDVSTVRCRKPNLQIGQVDLILPVEAGNARKMWLISTAAEDDDDLIDENDLLSNDELQTASMAPPKICDPVKQSVRKPCKNCTCGLANSTEQGQPEESKPSCGKCYLGDAFRCSRCPYRGLPPFKPGEQVTLKSSDVCDL